MTTAAVPMQAIPGQVPRNQVQSWANDLEHNSEVQMLAAVIVVPPVVGAGIGYWLFGGIGALVGAPLALGLTYLAVRQGFSGSPIFGGKGPAPLAAVPVK